MLQVLLEDSLNEKGSKLVDAFPKIENLLQQEDRSRRLGRKELFFWGYLTATHIANIDLEVIFKVIQKYSRHRKQNKFDLKEEQMILQRLVNNIEDPMLDFICGIEEAFQTTESYKNLYMKRAHTHRASAAQIAGEVSLIAKRKLGGFMNGLYNEEQKQKLTLNLKNLAAPTIPTAQHNKGQSHAAMLSARSARSVSREKNQNPLEKDIKPREKAPKKTSQKGYFERAKAHKIGPKTMLSPKAAQKTKNSQDADKKNLEVQKLPEKSTTDGFKKEKKSHIEIEVKYDDEEDHLTNKATNDGLLSSNDINSSPKLLTNYPSPSISLQSSPRRNSMQPFNSPLGSHRSTHDSRKDSRGLLDKIKESGQAQEEPPQTQRTAKSHTKQLRSTEIGPAKLSNKATNLLNTIKTTQAPKKVMPSLSPTRNQQKK